MNAKSLSNWGRDNPNKARIIITISHFILAPLFFLAGIRLYIQGVDLPGWMFTFLMFGAIAICIIYPGRKLRKVLVSRTWRNRKILDGFVVAFSMAAMLFIGNIAPDRNTFESQEEAIAIPIVERLNKQNQKKEARIERQNLRQQYRDWKKEIRQARKEYRSSAAQAGNGLAALWITLLIIGAVLVWFVLVILGCAVACNGMELLGTAIILVGTGGLILLLIFSIRAILRRNKANSDLSLTP